MHIHRAMITSGIGRRKSAGSQGKQQCGGGEKKRRAHQDLLNGLKTCNAALNEKLRATDTDFMEPEEGPDWASVAQRAIQRAASGLGWAFWRIQSVLHLLARTIEGRAGLFGGTFLMARGQGYQRRGAGNEKERFTNNSLLCKVNSRNGSDPWRLQAASV
jgi:hypothetical protein